MNISNFLRYVGTKKIFDIIIAKNRTKTFYIDCLQRILCENSLAMQYLSIIPNFYYPSLLENSSKRKVSVSTSSPVNPFWTFFWHLILLIVYKFVYKRFISRSNHWYQKSITFMDTQDTNASESLTNSECPTHTISVQPLFMILRTNLW